MLTVAQVVVVEAVLPGAVGLISSFYPVVVAEEEEVMVAQESALALFLLWSLKAGIHLIR